MAIKNSIVFGANGYLGRHLCNFLKKENIDFIPIDIMPASIDSYSNYKQVDIINKNLLLDLDFNVDIIFVFSALTGTNIGFEKYDNFITINEIGLLNILDYHKESNSKARIVFPSTRLVYKGEKDTKLDETSEKEAKTIYAQNKLSCESYLKIYQNMFNIDYTVFRICVPYGNIFDENYSYGTLSFFINKAKNKENIVLFGTGEQKRTFTHVEDIIRIIFKTISEESTKNEIYNIGSNDNLSLLEIANLIASKNGVKVEFVDWSESSLKLESGDTVFSDEKLKSEIELIYNNSIKLWIDNNLR